MEKIALRKLLVVLLCLSYVLYATAVPATRIPMIRKMVPLVLDDQAQEDLVVNLRKSEELIDMKKGRMMIDIEDYPPTGPSHPVVAKSSRKP